MSNQSDWARRMDAQVNRNLTAKQQRQRAEERAAADHARALRDHHALLSSTAQEAVQTYRQLGVKAKYVKISHITTPSDDWKHGASYGLWASEDGTLYRESSLGATLEKLEPDDLGGFISITPDTVLAFVAEQVSASKADPEFSLSVRGGGWEQAKTNSQLFGCALFVLVPVVGSILLLAGYPSRNAVIGVGALLLGLAFTLVFLT